MISHVSKYRTYCPSGREPWKVTVAERAISSLPRSEGFLGWAAFSAETGGHHIQRALAAAQAKSDEAVLKKKMKLFCLFQRGRGNGSKRGRKQGWRSKTLWSGAVWVRGAPRCKDQVPNTERGAVLWWQKPRSIFVLIPAPCVDSGCALPDVVAALWAACCFTPHTLTAVSVSCCPSLGNCPKVIPPPCSPQHLTEW